MFGKRPGAKLFLHNGLPVKPYELYKLFKLKETHDPLLDKHIAIFLGGWIERKQAWMIQEMQFHTIPLKNKTK